MAVTHVNGFADNRLLPGAHQLIEAGRLTGAALTPHIIFHIVGCYGAQIGQEIVPVTSVAHSPGWPMC